MTKFGGPIAPILTTFDLSKKGIVAPPPLRPPPPHTHIHLRVPHIPLINLMGLMTFFERKLCSKFWTIFGPSQKNRRLRRQNLPFATRGTKDFRHCHFVISGPSEPPPLPPRHQNKSVTITSIARVRTGVAWGSLCLPTHATTRGCPGPGLGLRRTCLATERGHHSSPTPSDAASTHGPPHAQDYAAVWPGLPGVESAVPVLPSDTRRGAWERTDTHTRRSAWV